MVANKKEQVESFKKTKIHLVSPDYNEAMHACAVNGRFSSAWTIGAVAEVIQREIVSIHPPVNGLMDITVPILPFTFAPLTNQNPPNPPSTIIRNHS